MKIRITKAYNSRCWYKNEVGQEFEVSRQPIELNGHYSYLIIEYGVKTRKAINTNDVEII